MQAPLTFLQQWGKQVLKSAYLCINLLFVLTLSSYQSRFDENKIQLTRTSLLAWPVGPTTWAVEPNSALLFIFDLVNTES